MGWEGASKNITAAHFGDTFSAFLMVVHELESLTNLGVKDVDPGPYGYCPICSLGYEGAVTCHMGALNGEVAMA